VFFEGFYRFMPLTAIIKSLGVSAKYSLVQNELRVVWTPRHILASFHKLITSFIA
jgi:hypothetical protein